jgi:CBS domain-containing protein
MTTAREIMTSGAEFVGEEDSVALAARRMGELGVGALPICGTDGRLRGMLTDRDIAVRVVGAGLDPNTTRTGELAAGEAITIGADDPIVTTMATMAKYQVRRLPVIDGHRLVGIITQADIARAELPDQMVGELLAALSID